MKITCPYCGNLFNDTLEKCPNCGAPNEGVVRKSGKQPITIEELKKWYQDRGLPPYETTRFFIGENYKKPRAFGIYKDTSTGNFVVYKNKADGSRAVRYEGTDEAYAVNELYQRLKQEIIQQKKANLSSNSKSNEKKKSKKKNLDRGIVIILIILFSPLISGVIAFIGLVIEDAPKEGYYDYGNTVYYAMEEVSGGEDGVNSVYWFFYGGKESDWSRILTKGEVPKELLKNKNAKRYYVSEEWNPSLGTTDFQESVIYGDIVRDYRVDRGYYDYDGTVYYHVSSAADDGWYYYNYDFDDWDSAGAEEVPEDLKHGSLAEDFYYTPTWDSSTQITDFSESAIYEDYLETHSDTDEESSSSWWDDDDDDYDYSWDSGSDWSSSSDWDSDW